MATDREVNAMRLAIALSARGLGTTSPNPPVGCVILDANGETVGTGYHERKGESHAEGRALEAAGERARGGTAVVTLEPCNHIGRAPACRQLLLDAGIERVVVALVDPTSRGEGGISVLRQAGVSVEVGVLADEARLVLGPWLDALSVGRPSVTVAYELSGTGSRPLRGVAAAELRSRFDVVLSDGGHIEEAVPDSHGQGVLTLPSGALVGDPINVLTCLFAGGARSVLVVGEQSLISSFVDADVVDRFIIFMSGSARSDGSELAVPQGFSMKEIAKVGQNIRIECARTK